ncbi:MAG: M23 family metallopeptidase [Ignavibacteriales bacterium]|nr:M23 family metallopeptidase [Ignavibacteriales bacterium]
MKAISIFIVLFFSTTLTAQEINFYGEAQQGGIIVGVGKDITSAQLNGVNLQIDKSGAFVFGFDRDAKGLFKVKIRFKNTKVKTLEYTLEPRKYEEQSLTIAKKYVTPPKRELKKIQRESKLMKAARAKVGKVKNALFMSGFAYPVDSVDIRSVFGSQRILNGKKANIHNGLDFSAEVGDSIRAISDGVVRIAGDNFYYNGNFILLDHGQGLTSVYLHMSKLLAKNSQKIKKGEVIGLAGSTGRATGPHLHLGVQWYKKRIDPMSLFNLVLPSQKKI